MRAHAAGLRCHFTRRKQDRGSSTRHRGGGWGGLSARGPPVWARTSHCSTGTVRDVPSPCGAPAPKSLALSEMSACPAVLLHRTPWHSQRRPLTLWGSCTRDPGTEVSRCSCLCPQSPRAHPHQGFLSLAPSVTRVSTKWGGTHTGTPFLQPFLQLMPEALGERAMSQEPHGPQDPLLMATASPASGITSLAGEDRAAHLQPWSTGTRRAPEPWGLWPRAPRGPMPCTRLKRGRAASPARAGLAAARPSPTLRGSAGTAGT